MNDSGSKSQTLVKNTLMLYVRMFITMLISLYTSRIVLKSLGVEDYGLYNVVGGLVALINIISSGVAASTQRFISYELGKNDQSKLPIVFSICVTTHIIFAILLLVLAETIGVWFLNNYIQIPPGRSIAANWVLQFVIASICVRVISIPFSSSIVSHERMNIYAYAGILEAILKLSIASFLLLYNDDRLILFGGLMFLVEIINFLIYLVYCLRHFQETHYKFYWDKSIFKNIFTFSSWTILGQGAMAASYQGTNILVNIFHSVRANAAMGIANQVNSALTGLTSNFYVAYQPQITKSYSANDYDYCGKLLYGASKLSFYLVFLIAIPIIYNINILLGFWLETVPENTDVFCVLFILSSMVNAFGNPFYVGVYATGRIKNLQILSTLLYGINLFLIWFLYKLGFPVYYGPAIKLFIDICLTGLRIVEASRALPFFSIRVFLSKIIIPIVISTIPVVIVFVPTFISVESIAVRLIVTIVLVVLSCSSSLYIGLNKQERGFVLGFVKKFVKR